MIDPFTLADQAGALLAALHDRDDPRVYRALIDERGLPDDDPACLWAQARRRYLRRIACLPEPSPRPAWWTAADEAARDPAHATGAARLHPYMCRTCALWRSQDGQTGYCGMEETEATVNCGRTEAWELCEQWMSYETDERAEHRALQLRKIAYIRRTAPLRAAALMLESEGWRVTGPEGGFVGWMSEGAADALPRWLNRRARNDERDE